jgi:hypothetical protein
MYKLATEKNGVITFHHDDVARFWREQGVEFIRRWKALQESKRQFNANLNTQASPAFKYGTCAICDASVQVAETEELPMTCAKAACVARFAQIAQRLGVRS